MGNLQVRPHERNPNLWWVSSQGDDVAYITRPGNAYLAWATDKWKPRHADFVGKRFDTVDEALQAVARSFREALADRGQCRGDDASVSLQQASFIDDFHNL